MGGPASPLAMSTTAPMPTYRIALAALLTAALYLALRPAPDAPIDTLEPPTNTSANDMPRRATASDQRSPVAPPEPITRTKSRVEVEPQSAPNSTPDKPEPRALLHGRVRLPDGSPVIGAPLSFRGARANNTRVTRYGLPKDWQDLTTTTDADGAFELRFDAPQAYQFFLNLNHPGYANEAWRWTQLAVDEDRDLGTITLRPEGVVEGRIVDAQGRPVGAGWRVYGDALAGSSGGDEGYELARSRANWDPNVQRFRLTGLPAGPTRVRAHHALGGWLKAVQVDVEAGATSELLLVYDGPEVSRRIEINTSIKPYFILSGRGEVVRLQGPGFDQTSDQSPHHFDDLAPGSYSVSVEHPLMEPYSLSGLEPGTRHTARLIGNARVALDALDAESDQRLESARVQLRLTAHENTMPNTFVIHDGSLPADGVLPPIVSGDTQLIIDAPGYAQAAVDLLAVQPGELRRVPIELRRAAALHGQVVRADGTPASGARVLVMRAGEPPAKPMQVMRGEGLEVIGALHELQTDPDGRFVVEDVTAGSADGESVFDVYAIENAWLAADRRGIEVTNGASTELTLQLPASAHLTVSSAEALPEGFSLEWQPTAEATVPPSRLGGQFFPLAELKRVDDGVWEGRELPPGPGELLVGRSSIKLSTGNFVSDRAGDMRSIASAELRAGQWKRIDLELGDLRPGTVTVDCVRDGEPLAGQQVLVQAQDKLAGFALTDNQGRATVEGVFPGPVEISALVPGTGIFRASLPPVEAARTTATQLDLSTTPGLLLVIGSDGSPAAERNFTLRCGPLETTGRTDAEGRLQVRVPAGTLQVEGRHWMANANRPQVSRATLSWPPTLDLTTVQLTSD